MKIWSADDVIRWISGETLLDGNSNSGSIIVRRALRVTAAVYGPTVLLTALLETGFGPWIDVGEIRQATAATLPWAGAIFGAAYAAFYTRFSSQWTYLAETYNLLMATQAQAPDDGNEERGRVYAVWKAAILEDAIDLHLATKPMFAPLVADLMSQEDVVAAYLGTAVRGPERLRRLQGALHGVLETEPMIAWPQQIRSQVSDAPAEE